MMSKCDLDGADDPGANLTERAYRSVSEMIVTSRLRGGDVIVESRLAKHLAISRTPLRAALVKLESEGLLQKGAGQSFLVRRVDLEDYVCCLRTRALLESEATERAIGKIPEDQLIRVRDETLEHWAAGVAPEVLRRLDDALHDLILTACGNTVLTRIVRLLRMRVWLYAMTVYESSRHLSRLESSRAEHLAVIDALIAGDAKRARAEMLAHLNSLMEQEVSRLEWEPL